jgi:hypothetical protein
MGISTWRAGITALWIASVEDIAASTDNFHATHGMFTLLLRISKMSISHS